MVVLQLNKVKFQLVEGGVSTSIVQEINGLDPEDQYDLIYKEILNIVEEASGLDPDLVEPTTPFMSLGLDSIMGVEIANRLGKTFSLDLQKTLIWTYSYMDALIAFLINELTKENAH